MTNNYLIIINIFQISGWPDWYEALVMMRAPFPSEPKSTFPTYQVPQQQESATMRGSAAVPPVQVAGAGRGGRAGPPSGPPQGPVAQRRDDGPAMSVITNGSSCRRPRTSGRDNSNVKMQSVTENCLLNYSTVTVPNRQRNGRPKSAAHNNSDKLDRLVSTPRS